MTKLEEAKKQQEELANQVSLIDTLPNPISSIAGMDVSCLRFDPTKMIHGSVVTMAYPRLDPLESAGSSMQQTFPYIPGFLGFREAPILIEAFRKLTLRPDLLFVDGHGICHPRRLGVASHVGVLLDLPTIGVAKSILIGEPLYPLGYEAGSQTPLYWKNGVVGMLVRTKKGCLPLVVSPGHKISLERAVEMVFFCTKKHRLPEPTRLAHLAANQWRKDHAR